MLNVYQVYFYSKFCTDVCCVLAAAKDSQQAINMAIEKVKCFPELDLGNPQVISFDMRTAHATVC